MTKIDVREAPAGPAVDIACATVLGAVVYRWPNASPLAIWPDNQKTSIEPYSSSIAAAWKLENAVEDIGEYLIALISVINWDRDLLPEDFEIGRPGMDWVLVDEDVWVLVHATPHQRARAFLLAHGIEEVEVSDDYQDGSTVVLRSVFLYLTAWWG